MEKAVEHTDDRGNAFVTYVANLDPGGRATLRRSLAFEPGAWPPAFRYVERWVAASSGKWERKVAYLVAGLQASSRAERHYPDLGTAARILSTLSGSQSVEARFLALLDADQEQLRHRLRQILTLMDSQGIAPDWEKLRRDLLHWQAEDRWVQQRWARSYYAPAHDEDGSQRAATPGTETRPTT